MRGFDDYSYESGYRPFRAPRSRQHCLDSDVICMDWQVGMSLAQTEVIDLTGIVTNPPSRRCHQDESVSSAWCAIHRTVPDWSGEVHGYTGPAGWICPDGGMFR